MRHPIDRTKETHRNSERQAGRQTETKSRRKVDRRASEAKFLVPDWGRTYYIPSQGLRIWSLEAGSGNTAMQLMLADSREEYFWTNYPYTTEFRRKIMYALPKLNIVI